jgi:hypothetical protein
VGRRRRTVKAQARATAGVRERSHSAVPNIASAEPNKDQCTPVSPPKRQPVRDRREPTERRRVELLVRHPVADGVLDVVYRHSHNREFCVARTLTGTAWVPFLSGSLPDILCEQHERTVGDDNCVSFEGLSLQLPADEFRYRHARTRVRVHRYVDHTLGVFHGPRKLVLVMPRRAVTHQLFDGGGSSPR